MSHAHSRVCRQTRDTRGAVHIKATDAHTFLLPQNWLWTLAEAPTALRWLSGLESGRLPVCRRLTGVKGVQTMRRVQINVLFPLGVGCGGTHKTGGISSPLAPIDLGFFAIDMHESCALHGIN